MWTRAKTKCLTKKKNALLLKVQSQDKLYPYTL